eukprot:1158318-Pelagomonas_calceolata.AAC.7
MSTSGSGGYHSFMIHALIQASQLFRTWATTGEAAAKHEHAWQQSIPLINGARAWPGPGAPAPMDTGNRQGSRSGGRQQRSTCEGGCISWPGHISHCWYTYSFMKDWWNGTAVSAGAHILNARARRCSQKSTQMCKGQRTRPTTHARQLAQACPTARTRGRPNNRANFN